MINAGTNNAEPQRPGGLPRSLPHPGPRAEQRIRAFPTRTLTAIRTLRSGERLSDELLLVTSALGVECSSIEILSGAFAPLHYCFPAEGDGQRAAWFSSEHITSKAQMIRGSATVGIRQGDPFTHSHLGWTDEQNATRGGHVRPDTIVGSPAPTVAILGLCDIGWESVDDPETKMPTFQPHSLGPKQTLLETTEDKTTTEGDVTAVVARVLPDEDITEAVRTVAHTAGFARATVRVGLGSLIGACFFDHSRDTVTTVEGPATEVIHLGGIVDTQVGAEDNMLSCMLVDRHGEVHSGTLVPGENPVAVTFELTITKA